jgi:cytochrome c oxidase subunit 3
VALSNPRFPITARHAPGTTASARRFFLLALATGIATVAITASLAFLFGPQAIDTVNGLRFPPSFVASSLLLLGGSLAMHRAVSFVRVEKQGPFRRWLLTALAFGATFMGVQTYGLWSMLPHIRSAEEASTGITPFVAMAATLHAIHFVVATLFVVLITVRTYADRYDHEYFFGVKFCAWFWHFLGLAWCLILAIMAIAVS